MKPLLQVRNLVTEFETEGGTVHAVNGVSYDLHPGESLAIVGESGSGKSVSVLSLLQLIPQPPGKIANGEVLFNGMTCSNCLSLSCAISVVKTLRWYFKTQ